MRTGIKLTLLSSVLGSIPNTRKFVKGWWAGGAGAEATIACGAGSGEEGKKR